MADPLIRHISDTARWAALYRARETERSDAIFRDPCARRLAGERGKILLTRFSSAPKIPGPGLREHIFSICSYSMRSATDMTWL